MRVGSLQYCVVLKLKGCKRTPAPSPLPLLLVEPMQLIIHFSHPPCCSKPSVLLFPIWVSFSLLPSVAQQLWYEQSYKYVTRRGRETVHWQTILGVALPVY